MSAFGFVLIAEVYSGGADESLGQTVSHHGVRLLVGQRGVMGMHRVGGEGAAL